MHERLGEKQSIERGTAEGFLLLYNRLHAADFRVVEVSDSPDVRCIDSSGQELNLEVTMTEDLPGDIRAVLGRSDVRSLRSLRAHLDAVRNGREPPLRASSLVELCATVADRIQRKVNNCYGLDAALVVRDSSGVDWDWDSVIPDIRRQLDLTRNPFHRGIWLISRTKDRLFRIL